MKSKHFIPAAALVLALVLTFNGCSGGDDNSSSNTFAYCLLTETKTCLEGSYDSSTCNGQLSNSCPYDTDSQTKKSSSSSLDNNSRNSSSSGNSSNSNTISGSGDYCIVEYKNPNQKSQCMKNLEVNGIDCNAYNQVEYATGRLSNDCPDGYTCSVFTDYMKAVPCDNPNTSSSSIYSSSSMAPSSSSSYTQQQSSSSITQSSSSNTSCTAYDNTSTQYCSNGTMKNYGYVTDGGGNTYKTVQIGSQTWMAEDWRGVGMFAECTGDNCFGLLDWATAMRLSSDCNSKFCSSSMSLTHKGVCASGWHIPNMVEWQKLFAYVIDGGNSSLYDYASSMAGKKLKATSASGTDEFGFSAMLNGRSCQNCNLIDRNSISEWWSDTETDKGFAFSPTIHYGRDGVYSGGSSKNMWYSVRCIKD